jgi:hypothetical protein
MTAIDPGGGWPAAVAGGGPEHWTDKQGSQKFARAGVTLRSGRVCWERCRMRSVESRLEMASLEIVRLGMHGRPYRAVKMGNLCPS